MTGKVGLLTYSTDAALGPKPTSGRALWTRLRLTGWLTNSATRNFTPHERSARLTAWPSSAGRRWCRMS